MINWKNTAENLGLIIIAATFGLIAGYLISIQSSERMIEQQKEIIEMAIRKETTNITNSVTTEIRKIKGKKTDPVNINIDPNWNSEIHQTEQDSDSSFVPETKSPGFFKRLFGNNKK
ncbi:hypothetical protein HCG49_17075 [Arenibacter sp. 6A1]|uniref:hypothetical protein n=1 Tax=Arenibacter sp. 6A1 TaxID=2720391 RepID=UPI001445FE6F|nr:hypothetical protein [Arenibacter sp. 6A1]NKI28269.1 hypothetical protein [Arenibacter sp. 6A1]